MMCDSINEARETYNCQDCGSEFTEEDDFDNHRKEDHGEEATETTIDPKTGFPVDSEQDTAHFRMKQEKEILDDGNVYNDDGSITPDPKTDKKNGWAWQKGEEVSGIEPHYYKRPDHDPYARKQGACVTCDMLPDNRVHHNSPANSSEEKEEKLSSVIDRINADNAPEEGWDEYEKNKADEFNIGTDMICPICNKEIDVGNTGDDGLGLDYNNVNVAWDGAGTYPQGWKMQDHFEQEHKPSDFGIGEAWEDWKTGNQLHDAFSDSFPEFNQHDVHLTNMDTSKGDGVNTYNDQGHPRFDNLSNTKCPNCGADELFDKSGRGNWGESVYCQKCNWEGDVSATSYGGESKANEDFGEYDHEDLYPTDPAGDDFRENGYLTDDNYNMSQGDMNRLYVDTMKEALNRAIQERGDRMDWNYWEDLLQWWSTGTAMFDLPHSKGSTPEAQQAFNSAKQEVTNWFRDQKQSQHATYPTPSWESKSNETANDEQCPNCNGSGKVNDSECPECDGDGYREIINEGWHTTKEFSDYWDSENGALWQEELVQEFDYYGEYGFKKWSELPKDLQDNILRHAFVDDVWGESKSKEASIKNQDDGGLQVEGKNVIKMWESMQGWYWYAIEDQGQYETADGGTAHAWYGFVQGFSEEWGTWDSIELEQNGVWTVPKSNWHWSGRRDNYENILIKDKKQRINESKLRSTENIWDEARTNWDSGDITGDISGHYFGNEDEILDHGGKSFDELPQNMKDLVKSYSEDMISNTMSMTLPDGEEWDILQSRMNESRPKANENELDLCPICQDGMKCSDLMSHGAEWNTTNNYSTNGITEPTQDEIDANDANENENDDREHVLNKTGDHRWVAGSGPDGVADEYCEICGTIKQAESRPKALEGVTFEYDIAEPYQTKATEADEKDEIPVEVYDDIYDKDEMTDSDEDEVTEVIRDRKMNGYGITSIASELMIKYGITQEEAFEKAGAVEVSVNDKVSWTFFGKKYSECNEAQKREMALYGGSE